MLIHKIGTLLKRNKHIRLTSKQNLDLWIRLFNHLSRQQRHSQIQVLLLSNMTYRTGISSTMTCINHHYKRAIVRYRIRSK